MTRRFALYTCLVLTAVSLQAQSAGFDRSPFASRIIPGIAPIEPPTDGITLEAVDQEESPFVFFAQPFALDTEGLRLAQLSTGFRYSGFSLPLRLGVSYSKFNPDEADDFEGYGTSVGIDVVSRKTWGLILRGSYSDTKGISHQVRAGFSAERKIGGEKSPFSVGADVLWADKGSATRDVSDVVPTARLILERPKFSVGADYTFDNDVDGDSDWTVELGLPVVPGTRLSVGVGDHTFYSYLSKTLSPAASSGDGD